MFGRMMNNYYYGKSGKGDFRKEDLPSNRWQLFTDTLRTRLSALCRINLLYMLIFLPTMIVLMVSFMGMLSSMDAMTMVRENEYSVYVDKMEEQNREVTITEEQYNELRNSEEMKNGDSLYANLLDSTISRTLLLLIPCIAITGPFTAGLSYVTRNWARDEHAFIWTDFKDAMKSNWKQSLVLSAITSILPLAVYVGWRFYGQLALQNTLMVVPRILVILVALVWSISITYMHPLAVTYELKLRDLIRNGLLMGVGRLPFSVGIRLLHCVPAALCCLLMYLWNPIYATLFLFAWYFIIGFALSRFITASYTNAVFDKYINSRMEGAKVNQGLRQEGDDSDEGDGEGNEEELSPRPE